MSHRLLQAALAASLFVLVLGLKLVAIDRYGMDLPEWDQWDAEGLHLLVPWGEHRLTAAELFQPHNEHRVVLTKLLGLAEVAVNGQWDQRLQCVVNATLHSAFAVCFFLFGCRGLGRRWHVPWFLLVAATCGLPLAWQNVLGGFHSQQYFLLATSFAAIALLPDAVPWSRAWWGGTVCAGLALLSMGSGLLAAAAVVAVVVLRAWHREASLRASLPTLAWCGLLIAVGLLTRVTVAYHDPLKAHGVGEFLLYLVNSFQWPAYTLGVVAAALWLPWLGLSLVLLERGPSAGPRQFAGIVWGLGVWTLLQLLATAYTRGAGGGLPASRYIDTLAFGLLVNGLALGWLCRPGVLGLRWRLGAMALAGVWAVAVVHGYRAEIGRFLVDDLPRVREYHAGCVRNTRDYLATGDAARLKVEDIPYPGWESYRSRVDEPALRRLLPASVRPPLTLAVAAEAGPFVAGKAATGGLLPATSLLENRRYWGSYGASAGGEWRSAPFAVARAMYLKFETAGDAGRPGVALEVREARSGALVAAVVPTRTPGATWRAAYAPVPRGEFVVVARVTDPARWLGFSEPVEMGWLSYWAWRVAEHGVLLTGIAAGLAALVLALTAWAAERNPEAPPAGLKPCPTSP